MAVAGGSVVTRTVAEVLATLGARVVILRSVEEVDTMLSPPPLAVVADVEVDEAQLILERCQLLHPVPLLVALTSANGVRAQRWEPSAIVVPSGDDDRLEAMLAVLMAGLP